MLDKLKTIKDKYNELSKQLIDPNVIADMKEYTRIAKEYSVIEPIANAYDRYAKLVNDIKSAEELIEIETDSEMLEMLEAEIKENKQTLTELEEEIKILLLPKDANDDKNVIMEIRSGAGGEESSLFCSVLFRMYSMYAEKMHWKVEVLDMSETELNGIKEVSFMVKGLGAFSKLKYESGVHRVQRVPETESQGRIHTSTSTVAVLPEHEDVDVEINEKDVKIDTYRSSGAGGQHVNTTDSAIRLTHLPTGIVVCCQDERSQTKNKEKAFRVLASKLYDYYQMQKDSEYAENRKNQVGTGDRSERIRTYNYPQGRLTDHRINYTEYNLQSFLDGNIDNLIESLRMVDQQQKLEKMDNAD